MPCTSGCDDGQPCTVDSCLADTCAHSLEQCDDGEVCTFDYCDNTVGCTVAFVDGPCDDGDSCTYEDACEAGSCIGAPFDCDDWESCTVDSCDPVLGACVWDFDTHEGQPCSDNDECSLNDTCFSGTCIGEALDCSDGVACTLDYCDPFEGCSNPLLCDDGSACTTDTCDDSGPEPSCDHQTLPAGAPCDDDYACSTNDMCDANANCIGEDLGCEDGPAQ